VNETRARIEELAGWAKIIHKALMADIEANRWTAHTEKLFLLYHDTQDEILDMLRYPKDWRLLGGNDTKKVIGGAQPTKTVIGSGRGATIGSLAPGEVIIAPNKKKIG
jgi:hypothetical protein